MTAKVTLNSPTGKRLDTRNIRFEWSKPEFYSAPPAGQTEPTWGSTPQTSGRAEPTPAPGPIPFPPLSETAESFAAPSRADPSPAPAAPAAANCLASADEVRRLAPKAWPKWTYGPHGERCWYSGRKPVFQKEMPAQAEAIPAPLSNAPIDTPSQAGSNQTQSSPCLASAAEVRKLTPHAWPKWTYGPNGARCWYSGEKPVFAKAPNYSSLQAAKWPTSSHNRDQSSRKPRSAEPLKCRWFLPTCGKAWTRHAPVCKTFISVASLRVHRAVPLDQNPTAACNHAQAAHADCPPVETLAPPPIRIGAE
jgi:hypothetical protein